MNNIISGIISGADSMPKRCVPRYDKKYGHDYIIGVDPAKEEHTNVQVPIVNPVNVKTVYGGLKHDNTYTSVSKEA